MDPKVIEKLLAGVEYESVRKDPPGGFPKLPDIPGGRYSDPEFQLLERNTYGKKHGYMLATWMSCRRSVATSCGA